MSSHGIVHWRGCAAALTLGASGWLWRPSYSVVRRLLFWPFTQMLSLRHLMEVKRRLDRVYREFLMRSENLIFGQKLAMVSALGMG